MRFLLISQDGDGLGIGLRLKDEGHQVIAHIRNKKPARDYDGILEKTDNFAKVLTPDTIIVFDTSSNGKMAERLAGQGYPTIGASMFADQLENDRSFGLGVMEEAGIRVPPSQHFTDWGTAIAYVKQKDERMCCKSDNDLPSYVSSSADDMIAFLEYHQKEKAPCDMELQDFVKGMEISTEGWFDGFEFSRPFNHTFERKQLMNDGLGPSGGCAGNVVWACQHDTCRIVEEGVKRIAPVLRHHGYRGMIDLNTIVNEEAVWGLEWTPRTGYDAFPTLMEMLTEGLGDTLGRYARGERMPKFPMKLKGFGSGLRVSIPPYPSDEFEAPRGQSILGLTRSDRQHAFFYNVMLTDDQIPKLVSSGAWGAIACFTGFGETIYEAMEGPLGIAKRCEIPSRQYRTDLTGVFERCLQEYEQLCQMQQDRTVLPEAIPSRR